MGIETGNYINDLDADWPLATDNVSDGDNHLRLIKKVIKASFPGVDRVSEYIYVNTSEPTVSVGKGRLWLDTSTTPNLLKIYDGSAFKKLPISATVDYKIMGNDTVGWVLPTADGTANYPLTTTGSNVLAFAQIATAAIADNAVDGAKIAMGSDAAGDILYHNGTDYVRLAKPGTPAGEALTFATSASAPSWAKPNFVGITQAIQSGSSYMRNDTSYATTGYSITHNKVSATSDLYVMLDTFINSSNNFQNTPTWTANLRLSKGASPDSGSVGDLVAGTTDDIQCAHQEDVGEGTGVTWDMSTGFSRCFKVTAANCPHGTTGNNEFQVWAKITAEGDDGGITFTNGTMAVMEIE